MDDPNSTTTRLLTLLNVSATKAGKRRKAYEDDLLPSPNRKLNKRKSVRVVDSDDASSVTTNKENITEPTRAAAVTEIDTLPDGQDDETYDDSLQGSADTYELHFGVKPSQLSAKARASMDQGLWLTSTESHRKLGSMLVCLPEGSEPPNTTVSHGLSPILPKLRELFQALQSKQPREQTEFQHDLFSALLSQRDLYLTSIPWELQPSLRDAVCLHVLNHVSRKRRRILKNNERLTHAAKTNPNAPPPEDVQDQGFTRPSVLFLLPFRSYALHWFRALTSHTSPPAFQIENQSRFLEEYGLPAGTIDNVTTADPGTYPRDHIELFKGNIDDNFKIGLKLNRKSVKMFAEFYSCDIIMASPLGLRMSIEKEKNADFLSSIEIVVADQMDALLMQNWEHVQFVFSNLNKLPKESHNTDFSRVKPWYLDGYSAYLRQSILLSAFETPEIRSLYNTSLKNVSGKARSIKRWPPIEIPEGIEQQFIKFECSSPKDEPDKRFTYFTTQLLLSVLKSAVQSANTVIFIPSSFDFIRVHNHFRKTVGVSFTVLSEYSTNQDISRARQGFFLGKKSILLISERFHFFRRYKIRGIRNIIFYGPPDHPQYFTEFLSYPFLDEGVEASDITCRVLYSKYDWFRLERIAGTDGAAELSRN